MNGKAIVVDKGTIAVTVHYTNPEFITGLNKTPFPSPPSSTASLPHLLLQLNAGVEAEVGLLGEVVDVEDDLYEGCLRDESPRLLDLAAEHPEVLAVADVCLRVAVHDLRRGKRSLRRTKRMEGVEREREKERKEWKGEEKGKKEGEEI